MGAIRLLLALSVALWHIPGHPFTLVYASPAVLGFFIISGFYMAMVLTEKYQDGARSFFVARFWRLYPAYFAFVAFMVFWYAFAHKTVTATVFTTRLPMPLADQIVLAGLNLFVAGQDFYELARNALGNGIFLDNRWMLCGQAWSLSSELFFYCLAPFVVRSPLRTAALLIAALALRWFLLGWLELQWFWGYFFFPGAMCMFLMGSLAYHLHARFALPHQKTLAKIITAGWIAWLVYAVARHGIMLGVGPDAEIDGPEFWFAYVSFALSVPLIFAWSKDNKLDRWIGELSYPLYLVHGVVEGSIFSKFGAHGIASVLFAISASLVAAVMLRYAIEVPVELWRAGKLAPVKVSAARSHPILRALQPARTFRPPAP